MKGENLSYSQEGEDRSVDLKLGANQTVKAKLTIGKEAQGKSLSGGYIAAQDYLCLSLNGEGKEGDNKGSSGSFILILRRQR